MATFRLFHLCLLKTSLVTRINNKPKINTAAVNEVISPFVKKITSENIITRKVRSY
jgi:hypothetical protein